MARKDCGSRRSSHDGPWAGPRCRHPPRAGVVQQSDETARRDAAQEAPAREGSSQRNAASAQRAFEQKKRAAGAALRSRRCGDLDVLDREVAQGAIGNRSIERLITITGVNLTVAAGLVAASAISAALPRRRSS